MTPPEVKCGFALARSGYAQYPAARGRAFVWLGFRRMQSDFSRAGRPVGHSAKFVCKIGLKHVRVTVTFGWAFSLDRHLCTST